MPVTDVMMDNYKLSGLPSGIANSAQRGQMEVSSNEGLRYAPLSIGFHFGIIGFHYQSSRSYHNAGFEYHNARQQFFETTRFPMPWR